MNSKATQPLSKEKLKIFHTEKNPENLLRFLMDDRADLITFLENPDNYQSDELVEMIAQNSIHLMGYVMKAASIGKNSWNDTRIINWMQDNAIDILPVAEILRNGYADYKFSDRVENNFFELLVKDHIIFKRDYMQQESLIESSTHQSYKVIKFMKMLPVAYIKKFESIDSELLNSLFEKPVAASLHMNLAQHVYFHKSQTGHLEEARELFTNFSDLILKPVCKDINGYKMKTDICDYYLKDADQLESWDFFAPMDYQKLNDNQKEVYLATGISHLLNESNRPLRSRNYSQEDIMNALMVVPNDRLKYYIDANKNKMAQSTGRELLALWMKNHLENDLALSPKVKGIKI